MQSTDGLGHEASAPVTFPEPSRFDDADDYTWAMTPPVLVNMHEVWIAQPGALIGPPYITERDSAPVQNNGVV